MYILVAFATMSCIKTGIVSLVCFGARDDDANMAWVEMHQKLEELIKTPISNPTLQPAPLHEIRFNADSCVSITIEQASLLRGQCSG